MSVEMIILKGLLILIALTIEVGGIIVIVLHHKLIKKEIELEIARTDAEIAELKRLRTIDQYLLDVIPDDDNWEPDDAFVKNVVAELNARGIRATEAEVREEMTDPDKDFYQNQTKTPLEINNMSIEKLARLAKIDKYLMNNIPDDDNWEPDETFVKDAVAELATHGIKVTEAEVREEISNWKNLALHVIFNNGTN